MPKPNAGAVSIAYELRGAGPPLLLINGFRRSHVLRLLPDASHFFCIEKPQETAEALIRFFAPA